jgi:hypothetical protein
MITDDINNHQYDDYLYAPMLMDAIYDIYDKIKRLLGEGKHKIPDLEIEGFEDESEDEEEYE